VAETNPVSSRSLITYSANEQVAKQDPQDHVVRSRYDPAGRLLQSTDPLSGMVQ
jgi:YD repeat-containing protein